MEKVEIGGVTLAYLRQGAGPPVVMIHGITTYSFLWRDVMASLAGDFDVIAPDLMGCGDSSKPAAGDYSLKGQADLLRSFMDTLGLEKVHLLSHDIGGGIAQILAVTDPGRFLSLSLVNTVGYDYWPVQPIVTMRIPLLRHLALASFDLGVFRALILRGFCHREKVTLELMERFRNPLRTHAGRLGFLALAKALDNSQLMAVADRLPGLPMPVLIVRGDRDLYLKAVISERLHREIPTSRYEVIATAGHFAPLDEPLLIAGLFRETALAAAARCGASASARSGPAAGDRHRSSSDRKGTTFPPGP